VDSKWSDAAEVADASCPKITFQVLELDGILRPVFREDIANVGSPGVRMSGASLLVCNYMLVLAPLVHQECHVYQDRQ
jgi:hypothetical protein